MNKFQISYFCLFFISLIGICGNIELGLKTSIFNWLILIITGFLVVGKLIYLEIQKIKELAENNTFPQE